MFAVPGHVAMIPNHTAFSSAIVITHMFNNACPWRSPEEPRFLLSSQILFMAGSQPPCNIQNKHPSVAMSKCHHL